MTDWESTELTYAEDIQRDPNHGCLPWVIVIPAGVVFWVAVAAGLWTGGLW